MKKVKLAAVAVMLLMLAQATPPAAAQDKKKKAEAQRPAPEKVKAEERLESDDTTVVPSDVSPEVLANRQEQLGEEAESLNPYYNNFFSTYRLGPEDVISINVFDLDRYTKSNITIPPDGRIDYFFIKGGLHVVGKTRRQVEDEITRHLEEYINTPQVTVTLEKAMSMRYGVLGEVAKPGIFIMNRRLSVYEAVIEAGGVLRTGSKKVVLVRHNADRMLQKQVIDIAAIEKGKTPDNFFLRPGDQIFVPGNKWKTVDKIMEMIQVVSFARIFTGGF
jgi:polysaccharide export outer membrane protein